MGEFFFNNAIAAVGEFSRISAQLTVKIRMIAGIKPALVGPAYRRNDYESVRRCAAHLRRHLLLMPDKSFAILIPLAVTDDVTGCSSEKVNRIRVQNSGGLRSDRLTTNDMPLLGLVVTDSTLFAGTRWVVV